ncbi:hypothetical protein I2492_04220 [Budviciaceae bacterium CWB-B4]|uniref:Uncharacterized protein n=1 Tax=Limnobaculum xujianqingii TaxID=2738837 RepID=A0A9D7AGF3_9GAMM|nr:hypothetical protein [Limnobaculum xujianqingii]MBK5072221.1 hypothetical protein [Limnobaculum xujianqingii]MBK5175530.1 hypothetical protein [Limnobaculum xujianqingii]
MVDKDFKAQKSNQAAKRSFLRLKESEVNMPEHRPHNIPPPNKPQALQHINLIDELMRKHRMSAGDVLNAVTHLKSIAGDGHHGYQPIHSPSLKNPPGPE